MPIKGYNYIGTLDKFCKDQHFSYDTWEDENLVQLKNQNIQSRVFSIQITGIKMYIQGIPSKGYHYIGTLKFL